MLQRPALLPALAVCALAPAAFLGAAPAAPIGGATVIFNDVVGNLDGQPVRIVQGDTVFRDQFVRTAMDSRAKLVFLDSTNLAMGPESTIKLDRFVYNGDGTARSVAITAGRGAFRIFSGASPHEAYRVNTPQAVIGVRGTTYDVRVDGERTIVVLQDGAVNVCTLSNSVCRDLAQPGYSLIVTQNNIEGPLPPAAQPWNFGDLCGGDLCRKTTRFGAAPPPPPPSITPPSGPAPTRYSSLPPAPPVYMPPTRVLPPPVYTPPTYTPPTYTPPTWPTRPPRVVVLDPPRHPPRYPTPPSGPGRPGGGDGRPTGEHGGSTVPGKTTPGNMTPGKTTDGKTTDGRPTDGRPRYPTVPGTSGRYPGGATQNGGVLRNPGQRSPWGAPGGLGSSNPRVAYPGRNIGPALASRLPPRMTQPRLYQPRMTQPRVYQPRMSQPRFSGNRFAQPRMSSPRMSSPRMSAPRMSAPRMAAPRMSSRGFGGGRSFGGGGRSSGGRRR